MKVVCEIDINGNLIDSNGQIIYSGVKNMNFTFEELDESKIDTNVAQLIAQGMTADDLLKLKAGGVI